MRHLLWMAGLLAVAGCTPERAEPVPDPPLDAGSESAAAAPATAPPAPADAPGPAPPRGAPPLLALDGEGLRAINAATGSTRLLAFGARESRTIDLLTTHFGTDPVDRGSSADCGADYARWMEGLTVWFDGGRFVGWAVREGSALTTLDGWGPGSTRADVEASRTPTVMRSSLGVEFTVGGIAGIFESTAARARIQHLWAGHVCLAR